MRRRLVVVVVLAGVLALAAAGCGGDDEGGGSASATTAAPQAKAAPETTAAYTTAGGGAPQLNPETGEPDVARTDALTLEGLESRLLLSVPSEPPDLSLLENASNPVVRLETDLGRIDIEVLMNEAPIAGANFLQMLRSGASDLSFFHSLSPGETLGAGLFKLVDGAPSALT